MVIKGGHKKEVRENDSWQERSYSYNSRVALPENCKMYKTKVELKNGSLNITVPKGKVELKVIDVRVQCERFN